MDPNLGRFTSEDPLGFVDGPNFYIYARQAPTLGTDPMGTAFKCGDIDGKCVSCIECKGVTEGEECPKTKNGKVCRRFQPDVDGGWFGDGKVCCSCQCEK
jgi:hypothetical protein